MGKIYYIMGKSASGKDTIYNKLFEECPEIKGITLYTTRPKRDDETDGRQYYFVSEEELSELDKKGKIIEKRVYHTIHGLWSYATIDDGQINFNNGNYVVIGTLDSYNSMIKYFGNKNIVPVYIELDNGTRLTRALNREKLQKEPKYTEMCRRFLADEIDFSPEKLQKAGIIKKYINEDLRKCLDEIKKNIEY